MYQLIKKTIITSSLLFMAMFVLYQTSHASDANWIRVPVGECGVACSFDPASPKTTEEITVTASIINPKDPSDKMYSWNGGALTSNNKYVTSYDDAGTANISVIGESGGESYGPTMCSVNVCSISAGDACTNTAFCPDKDVPGVLACNGTTCIVPFSTTCGDTCDPLLEDCGTAVCPILSANNEGYTSSSTFSLFDSNGNFVLTDPDPGDSLSSEDLFDRYFRTPLQNELTSYGQGTLTAQGVSPIVFTFDKSTIPATISGYIDNSCSASVCDLNPRATSNSNPGIMGNNAACSLLKQGENIVSANGCYTPEGAPSVQLLTSPNFVTPGEYCSVTWCAQGTAISSCSLKIGDREVENIGTSGVKNILMGQSSQRVEIICIDSNGSIETQRTGECKIDPDWSLF